MSYFADEDALNKTQADYDPYFRMFRPTGAPPPMERENETAYRRRLAESLQQHAPKCQGFQYSPFYWDRIRYIGEAD